MLDCWTKGKETDAQVQDSQVTSSWKQTVTSSTVEACVPWLTWSR